MMKDVQVAVGKSLNNMAPFLGIPPCHAQREDLTTQYQK